MTIPKAPDAQQDETPRAPAASDERARELAVAIPERPRTVSAESEDDDYADVPCTD